jgi:hypothetical protein
MCPIGWSFLQDRCAQGASIDPWIRAGRNLRTWIKPKEKRQNGQLDFKAL